MMPGDGTAWSSASVKAFPFSTGVVGCVPLRREMLRLHSAAFRSAQHDGSLFAALAWWSGMRTRVDRVFSCRDGAESRQVDCRLSTVSDAVRGEASRRASWLLLNNQLPAARSPRWTLHRPGLLHGARYRPVKTGANAGQPHSSGQRHNFDTNSRFVSRCQAP